jgi:CubicO group peptidase (beta-lactamase class C family)
MPPFLHAATLSLLAMSACIGAHAAVATPEQSVARIERSLPLLLAAHGHEGDHASIEARMRFYGVPGLSVAVIHDGKIAWTRAYGRADVAARAAMTTDTIFEAGSVSKSVAATAAMRLVQDGRLQLDTDVGHVLHSWRLPDNPYVESHPVTLSRLLSHSAGIDVHGFDGYAAGHPVPTLRQVLDGTAPANSEAIRVVSEPGAGFAYSGGGYTIVQQMIEDVSGESFASFAMEHVLTPWHMTSSSYEQPLPSARSSRAASGYRAGGTPVDGRFHTYPEQAAAGLWSTPGDLARFVIGLEDAFAGRSQDVLDRATALSMISPQRRVKLGESDDDYWGLGVELGAYGNPDSFSHTGVDEGFDTLMLGFAHGRDGVVIMTNINNSFLLQRELMGAIAQEYGWKPFTAGKQRTYVPWTKDELREYPGRYTSLDGTTVSIEARSGRLVVADTGERYEMFKAPDARVFAPGEFGALVPQKDNDSQVTGFKGEHDSLKRI